MLTIFSVLFLGTVHSERQLLGVQPGAPGHAKPPRTRLVTLCDLTCREGLSVEDTSRRYRGLSTFLNSLDDI